MSRPVYCAYSNIGYRDFALNLCMNFKTNMPDSILYFYCLDEYIYELLMAYEFPNLVCVEWYTSIRNIFLTYGTYEYNKLTHTKMDILLDSIQNHEFIHFIDCDVAFFKQPTIDFYNEYKEFDIVFQVDSGPEDGDYFVWLCTGNMTLRKNERTIAFLQKIKEQQALENSGNDQEVMYEMLKAMDIKDCRQIPGLRSTVYPRNIFVNGLYLKLEGITEQALNFHANYVVGPTDKKDRLKSVGLWYV